MLCSLIHAVIVGVCNRRSANRGKHVVRVLRAMCMAAYNANSGCCIVAVLNMMVRGLMRVLPRNSWSKQV